MSAHTFRATPPSDSMLADEIGTSLSVDDPRGPLVAVVTLGSDTRLGDAQDSYAKRGWAYVGSGDQRPSVPTFTQSYSTTSTTIAALASWSAPGISANYSAGITLLTGASAADLNNLASKCATLEAEIAAHRTEIATLKGNINALVDLLQARGLAA